MIRNVLVVTSSLPTQQPTKKMVPHFACLEQVSFIFAVVLIFINISHVPTSIILLACWYAVC